MKAQPVSFFVINRFVSVSVGHGFVWLYSDESGINLFFQLSIRWQVSVFFSPKILHYPFKPLDNLILIWCDSCMLDLPPCSMSESVRCVREKLAMLAGDMENRE